MTADEEYMTVCIELAKKAAEKGECPVGAVVVNKDGEILGRGYNMRETLQRYWLLNKPPKLLAHGGLPIVRYMLRLNRARCVQVR